MSLPGPFLAGQRLTAGQLNDATQKTLDSVTVTFEGIMVTTVGAAEIDIPRLALGPVPLVAGGLYRFGIRLILTNTVETDEFTCLIRRDTALTGTIVGEVACSPKESALGKAFDTVVWSDLPAIVSESGVNFFFSLKRFAGTGTMSAHGKLTSRVVQPGAHIARVGYSSEFRVSA